MLERLFMSSLCGSTKTAALSLSQSLFVDR
jgi:hypothetical protein